MASKNLPTNIDSTYADDSSDPSVQAHQVMHDDIAEVVNLFDYDAILGATPGYYLYIDPSTGLVSVVAPSTTVTRNLQTGTAYTPTVADNGKIIELSNAAAITVTIPVGVFTDGMQFGWCQAGAGIVTFAAAVGMTLRSEGGLLSSHGQWAEGLVRFRSATEFVLSGNLA